MANTSNVYPRETIELVPLTVTDTTRPVGMQAVTVYDVQITEFSARPVPTAWVPNTSLPGPNGTTQYGVMLPGNLTEGTYKVWVRYIANPETPVVEAGWFILT